LKPRLSQILSLPAIEAAPRLLGWILCRQLPEGLVKLQIVETEAYHQDDPASHSFKGNTKRTDPMFKAGGRIYVYFSYGMHYAVNIVVGKEGVGEAVLLRAGQPVEGIDIMSKNRGLTDLAKLASGPGRLAKAIGIKDTSLSGKILDRSSIWLEPPAKQVHPKAIITAPRIGISKATEMPWRFYLKDNPFVSRI
jgi:DNA-3-methyladenine glycosylase